MDTNDWTYSDVTSGKNLSCWLKEQPVPSFTKLSVNIETDIIIVGAGIAGLTCAYNLVKQGKRVVVLEDGEIGSGETGRTTAHLMSALDDRYFELQKHFGKDGAKTAADSHKAAIDFIENVVKTENIDCNFKRLDGYLFLSSDTNPNFLSKELQAAKESGMDVERVPNIPVDFWKSGDALRFSNQGEFHPMKYLVGLANAVVKYGGKIYTHTHARSISGGHSSAEVETGDNLKVIGKCVVVATNVPVNDRVVMFTKLAGYRSYVITCKIPKGSVPSILFWDTAEPYHYVRVTPSLEKDYDLLVVGGEDHKTGQATDFDARYERLWTWTKERFPMVESIVDKWSGQVSEPVDSLAYIGRNPSDYDNVFIITGDSGTGMTHGTIGGILIPDLILFNSNPWEKLYEPSRKPIHELTEFAKENINTQFQYKDWVTPGEITDIEDLKPGCGAIMRSGMSKLAIYKDDKGTVHKCSAVCPHLGAIVHWNDSEKTWDCPAHGSRFDEFGRVVTGPANCDLKKMEEPVMMKELPSVQQQPFVELEQRK